MLKIVSAPNPILSQKAKSIKKIDKSILKLIKEMGFVLSAARDPVGVGLAAPQVGQSLKTFLIKPTEKSPIHIFINPTIIEKTKAEHLTIYSGRIETLNKNPKKSEEMKLEGCLSLPNIWGEVKREPEITISYLDENGKSHTRKFSGFITTIVQHEMDHLQGVLFPKRVLEQKGTLYKSHKNEKGEDIFEKIEI